MIYLCCDENRRQLVRAHPVLNGIDHVEVLDGEAPPGSPRQRTLLVRFVKAAPALDASRFEITGGERIDAVKVVFATPAAAPDPTLVSPAEAAFLQALPRPDEVVAVRTDSSGDYSTYTLGLVAAPNALAPPPGIDPLLARVAFSFKVECASDFDCAPRHDCPPEAEVAPVIDYLAKDYGSFRRLMLDRMAQILPGWAERNPADLGIALVEILAYVGDRLSYAQDAVATEAFIGTARRRPSVRRHARLVDYFMHDGANARVWVQVRVEGDPVDLARAETKFLTRVAGAEMRVPPPQDDPLFGRLLLQRPLVFEPLHDKTLHEALNEIDIYDWGDSQCCLPKGAVRATLDGDLQALSAGDVLVFEERLGPRTGRASDADPANRWAVRLVQVLAGITDPATDPPRPITEIRWAEEDALPFALCLSSRLDPEFGGEVIRGVSRALGNIVLADHGLTFEDIEVGVVPQPHLHLVQPAGDDPCDRPPREAVPPRFRPLLPEAPLTQAVPYPRNADATIAATVAIRQSLREVTPAIRVFEGPAAAGGLAWSARRDLLGSDPASRHFVVEIEQDGRARLRFGDGRNGRRPASGTAFTAAYRIGNGPIGNIGADAIAHIVTGQGGIVGLRNPIGASGGTAPESMASARLAAGQAYRVQERAVTEADYAEMARRHPSVQRAAATLRWNGHGHTVFVTVDRYDGRAVTPDFETELLAFLEPYRMAGYDLEIDEPRFVALDLEILICVKPEHFRSQVRLAVIEELSERRFADGRYGFFHPDEWSFDQDVALSAIVARVQSVEGVESVTVMRFGRLDVEDPAPLETGILPIGRLEIARLANDPDFPEHGRLVLKTGGGK